MNIKIREILKKVSISVAAYLPFILWSLIVIIAVAWVVINSFKTNPEFFQNTLSFPKGLNLRSYRYAWIESKMSRFFLNTAIISISTVLTIDIIASMASYILSKYNFRGNTLILLIFIGGMAIPAQLVLVPIYLLFHKLGLLNSLFGLFLIYVAVSLPFSVFVLTGFFRTLPSEIEEAALIDGCSDYGVFWRISLPMAKSGIFTVSIFNFIGAFNEYLIALMLINKESAMTLPIGLYRLQIVQSYAADWTGLLAGLVIVMIPSITIFVLLRRYIVGGLTVGALKG